MNFGSAIEAMKLDKKVARKDWDKSYLIIYKGQIDIAKRMGYGYGEYGEFSFIDTIAIKTSDNKMSLAWAAKHEDLLADDWVIIE